MVPKLTALIAALMMVVVPKFANASDQEVCAASDKEPLPRMVIVRVPEGGSTPEYAFSNANQHVKDAASAQQALKGACSKFAPLTETEDAVPEAVAQWFDSESQVASLNEDGNDEWIRFRRFYRNYGRYGFYGYRYPYYRYNYYRPYGRFGFYYNTYRYPYYNYYYSYPYGGYRYYYYYNPYYRWRW